MKVLCKDGSILGFTNLDAPLTYDDGVDEVTYSPDNGFSPSQFDASATLSVDNAEIQGWIAPTGITEAQIRAGLFDFARIYVYRVNYLALEHGHILMASGTAGETVFSDNGWKTEFRSKTQQLKQPVNENYSLTCAAKFGDARCGKALEWTPGTVTSVGVENDRIFTDTLLAEADHHYDYGVVRFTSGNNSGFEVEVETQIGDVVTFLLPTPVPIQVGDDYEIRLDCTKEFAYCRDVHNNVLNNRSEHLIPVQEAGAGQIPGAQM